MERKLDVDKEHDMIKYLLEDCIPHDFVRHMYKQENYAAISKPNLTSQKTNNIFKNYLLEESNRINILKYKYGEKFPLIHCIYLLLFSKIYNRTNNFGIQNKNNFDFYFQTWKNRKTAGAIAPKILKQLPLPQANQVTTEVLSTVKDPSNYQDEFVSPAMVSVNNTVDENAVKQRVAKRKVLEEQLSQNTARMNKIKKNQINCKCDFFFLFNKIY